MERLCVPSLQVHQENSHWEATWAGLVILRPRGLRERDQCPPASGPC